jgi:uncharacterized protein YecE (DUF72 family)
MRTQGGAMRTNLPTGDTDSPPATNLRIGTSGFGYREWLGKFYPPGLSPKEMLPFYAERFSTVEINSTFYRMPALSVLESWMSQVQQDFIFTFKAPGLITHRKRLRSAGEETAAFTARISVLGHNTGPTLFLLPANLPCNIPLLGDFLDEIAHLRIAFEFRHPSWFNDGVFSLLRDHDCAMCISDRDGVPPPPVVATTDFGYARLRRSGYTDEQLQEWKKRISEQGWKEAFVYFRHEETATGPVFARRMMEV